MSGDFEDVLDVVENTDNHFVCVMYDPEDHDLFLTPKIAYFSSLKGGASRHMMVNGSDKTMAIKIKCSNNELYRVSPVFCRLDPGKAQRLQIVRDGGEPRIDKIIVLYKTSDCPNPRDAFQGHSENDIDIQKRLIALIARNDIAVAAAPKTNIKTILKQNS